MSTEDYAERAFEVARWGGGILHGGSSLLVSTDRQQRAPTRSRVYSARAALIAVVMRSASSAVRPGGRLVGVSVDTGRDTASAVGLMKVVMAGLYRRASLVLRSRPNRRLPEGVVGEVKKN